MFCSVSTFGYVLLFLIVGLLFVMLVLGVGKLFRPHKPNSSKNSTYECGEESVSQSWGTFNIRFYLIALIFVLFEIEIIFLFPWATVFSDELLLKAEQNWKIWAFVEGLLFILILVLGLAYLWSHNLLSWERISSRVTPPSSGVASSSSKELYENINERYRRKD